MDANKLTVAQQSLLFSLRQHATLAPPSGRPASAWWRTADVLVRKGLATTNGYVLNLVEAKS